MPVSISLRRCLWPARRRTVRCAPGVCALAVSRGRLGVACWATQGGIANQQTILSLSVPPPERCAPHGCPKQDPICSSCSCLCAWLPSPGASSFLRELPGSFGASPGSCILSDLFVFFLLESLGGSVMLVLPRVSRQSSGSTNGGL